MIELFIGCFGEKMLVLIGWLCRICFMQLNTLFVGEGSEHDVRNMVKIFHKDNEIFLCSRVVIE